MQIQIHSPWDVNAYTEGIIREKVEKLSTYYDRIERADVYLKTGDSSLPDAHIAEIRLAVPGPDLYADDSAENLEKAIASVTEKLRRQLMRHKAKLDKNR